ALRGEFAGLERERPLGTRNGTGDANGISHEWLLSDGAVRRRFGETGSVPSWQSRPPPRPAIRGSRGTGNRQPTTMSLGCTHDRCRSCNDDTCTFQVSTEQPTW